MEEAKPTFECVECLVSIEDDERYYRNPSLQNDGSFSIATQHAVCHDFAAHLRRHLKGPGVVRAGQTSAYWQNLLKMHADIPRPAWAPALKHGQDYVGAIRCMLRRRGASEELIARWPMPDSRKH